MLLKYERNIKSFLIINTSPFCYWLSNTVFSIFKDSNLLENCLFVKNGMSTTDNNRFLRLWYEINNTRIGLNCSNRCEALETHKKWFPYNKGGDFRKWYGNVFFVCNWENDGKEIRKCAENASGGRIVSEEYYFNESISWSKISSGKFSLRLYRKGFLFDVAGPSIFGNLDEQLYVLGLGNSCLKRLFIESIAPTLNYERGQVSRFPIVECGKYDQQIINYVKENVGESQRDWDSFETSWDFKKHPLI